MNKTGWKVIAIIFIILFLLETAFLIWAINYGINAAENEIECSVNVCGDDIYDSYTYDDYTKLCVCYTDHEPTKQEYMR